MHARRIRHVGPMVLQGVSWSDAADLLPSRYARAVRGADGLGQGGSRIAHWIVAAPVRQIRLETPTTHEYNHHDSETQMVCRDRR